MAGNTAASARSRVREWTQRGRRGLPSRDTLRHEAVAGMPGAIGSVPDGMAASVLAGISPVHGLYASFAGPIAGGLSSSTRLIVITTTSAAALAAGSAIQDLPPNQRAGAVALLTLVAGLAMVVAGALRLGRFTRFVSHSVMKGFLTGVAANIICGQVPDLTGTTAQGSFPLARAIYVLAHPSMISIASVLTGVAAIALIATLSRVRKLAAVSALIALVIPTLVVALAGIDGVKRVEDLGAVPKGLPLPALPNFGSISLSLVGGAFAVAAIVLVQGAGVSESAPNPDGSLSNANGDFFAQGLGNVASGLFKGQPVGGSVGQTALNVAAGARTRWASVFSGIWMLLILVAFSGLVGKTALPTLAGLLMFAAVGSVNVGEIATIFRTSATSKVALVSTLVFTLLLPIAVAVGIGVVISLLLQLNQEALDLAVVEIVPLEDGRFSERPEPETLESHKVTMLDVYGSLLYAGSRTLQVRLPDPGGSTGAAVVIRLRGRTTLGSTFFSVISDYSARLEAVGGRLYLSGVADELLEQFARTVEADNLFMYTASDIVGASSHEAYEAAKAWTDSETPSG